MAEIPARRRRPRKEKPRLLRGIWHAPTHAWACPHCDTELAPPSLSVDHLNPPDSPPFWLAIHQCRGCIHRVAVAVPRLGEMDAAFQSTAPIPRVTDHYTFP